VAAMLDQFAERLAVAVDILEQLIARLMPAGEPTFQFAHVGVTQSLQSDGGLACQTLAIVIDHDRRIEARNAPAGLLIDPAQRNLGGEQRVALREFVLLAHVDQRDLAPDQQRPADILRRGGQGRVAYAVQRVGSHAFLDLSQRLGVTLFA